MTTAEKNLFMDLGLLKSIETTEAKNALKRLALEAEADAKTAKKGYFTE